MLIKIIIPPFVNEQKYKLNFQYLIIISKLFKNDIDIHLCFSVSIESHGSVVSHLLSQVKIGMDLTKVALPTFILERRSLLEMYADYFAHPDMFVR